MTGVATVVYPLRLHLDFGGDWCSDVDIGSRVSGTSSTQMLRRSQAEGLQSRLSSGGAAAEEMAGAELIMCSPLTRALQTCLIGLQPILVPADGIGRGGVRWCVAN